MCSGENKVCLDERSSTFVNPGFSNPFADADHPRPGNWVIVDKDSGDDIDMGLAAFLIG